LGLRGPGAKPIKRPALTVVSEAPAAHPWDAPGLSPAERVIAFVESLPVTSGSHAGRPFRLRPWQKKFVRAVYATDRAGLRKVRTAVLSVARKNGKTDICARLALCHIAGPMAEQRGEVYSAANDRFQASRIFKEMVAIIERVPWLAERVSIVRHSKELEDIGGTGTIFAALSSDVGTKHGLSPSFVVYDELGQAPTRDLYDVLDSAMGARAEPLMLVISTQAARDDAPMSELIDYGLRVNDGEVKDATFHATLYAAPKDADPWSPATWKAANPALGDFRSRADVERLAQQAQRMPSREASFRNLILNQRVDATAQFLSAAVWKACGGAMDAKSLKGRTCFAGLDLAATRDLTAFVRVFADDDGFDVLASFFLPGDTLAEREDADRAPYTRWAREGHLIAPPGKTMDPAAVAREIARLHGEHGIEAIAFDRWRIEDLRRELSAIGCEVELVPWGQGFKDMSPAIDVLERLVLEEKLRHGGNPVLTMCALNAKTTADPAGNRKLDKQKSTGRIDGLQALAMALGLATRRGTVETWEPLMEVF
jgi:phage terminase large subunit-like protein